LISELLSCLFLVDGAASAAVQHFITFNTPSIGSIIAIFIAVLGLFMSGFISGSEIAFFSLSPEDCDKIDDDDKRDTVNQLLSAPEKLLATVLIANNFVNVSIVILCNFAMDQIFIFNSSVASFIVQTVIMTFLILLFGEILPKLYANNYNVRFAVFACNGLSFLTRLFSPVSRLMVKSTVIVNKMVPKHPDDISMEDLSQALEISDVKSNDEKEILEGIIKFGDTSVAEIMRPRVDVTALELHSSFSDVERLVIDSGYSRIPVFDKSPDNIKGLLYAKDLLPYIGTTDKDFKWQNLLREAYFVPETRRIDDLLEDFRTMKIHMAVVVDEFGCTQGIATLEDVLEEIVGDIDDEYDTVEKSYSKINDNTYIFDGKTLLGDFFRITGIDEHEFDDVSEDAETIAGLLLNLKGDFPKEKEPIVYGRCHFLVLKIVKHRIAGVRIKILPDAGGNSGDKQ
jgi:putative hemolysin